jgi:metal-responsive CopG/Arc/MetJ family transcriptional regulator
MPSTAIPRAVETMTIRLERKLKDEFVAAAKFENRPASEVLRDLMTEYVEHRERQQFVAEARRQSELVALSFDSKEVDLLFEETWKMPGWQ